MKLSFPSIWAVALAVLPSTSTLVAQTTVYSEVVGFDTVACLAASDTRVSPSFTLCPEFTGTVASASSTATTAQITPSAGAWTPGAFANGLSHYVRFTSGALNGQYFSVLSNTSNSATLDFSIPGGLSAPASGDSFEVLPYWTLDTLFPPATQTAIVPSLSTAAAGRRTEVRIPDSYSAGINKPSAHVFFLYAGTWYRDNNGTAVAYGSGILRPDSHLIIRHWSAAVAAGGSTTFTTAGLVPNGDHALPLHSAAATKQDTALSIQRPLPVAISGLGFTGAEFTDSTNLFVHGRKDEIHVWDNAHTGIDKSPAKVYFRFAGNWYLQDGANAVAVTAADVIDSSTGFTVRKFQTGTAATVSGLNTPNY